MASPAELESPAAPAGRRLRVVVADGEPAVCQFYRDALPRLGHEVIAAAGSGRELVEHGRALRPDLVITDVALPGEPDGIRAAEELCQNAPVPVVLVTGCPEDVWRARCEHILACLVKPVREADLPAAVALAVLRFGQFRAARREAAGLRQALEDRILLERAKGAVMKRLRLGEEEAFGRLRRFARNSNRKLAEAARAVLAADAVFARLEAL